MYSEKFIYYYFCLVLLIGGLGYTPWALFSYGMFPSYWFLIFMLIGGASPTIAALIASRLEFGRKGPEQLFSSFSRIDFPKLWFLCRSCSPSLPRHARFYYGWLLEEPMLLT